jgi:WD40 repeat protein
LAYSADDKTVAVASFDEIQLWDVTSHSRSGNFTGKLHHIMSLARSSHCLAAGSWDGDLKIWDLKTGVEVVSIKAHPAFLFALAFSPDGEALVTGLRRYRA